MPDTQSRETSEIHLASRGWQKTRRIPRWLVNRLADLLAQGLPIVGQKTGQVVALEMLPKAFDRIEIRTVGRKIDRIERID